MRFLGRQSAFRQLRPSKSTQNFPDRWRSTIPLILLLGCIATSAVSFAAIYINLWYGIYYYLPPDISYSGPVLFGSKSAPNVLLSLSLILSLASWIVIYGSAPAQQRCSSLYRSCIEEHGKVVLMSFCIFGVQMISTALVATAFVTAPTYPWGWKWVALADLATPSCFVPLPFLLRVLQDRKSSKPVRATSRHRQPLDHQLLGHGKYETAYREQLSRQCGPSRQDTTTPLTEGRDVSVPQSDAPEEPQTNAITIEGIVVGSMSQSEAEQEWLLWKEFRILPPSPRFMLLFHAGILVYSIPRWMVVLGMEKRPDVPSETLEWMVVNGIILGTIMVHYLVSYLFGKRERYRMAIDASRKSERKYLTLFNKVALWFEFTFILISITVSSTNFYDATDALPWIILALDAHYVLLHILALWRYYPREDRQTFIVQWITQKLT